MLSNHTTIPIPALAIQSLGIGLGPTVPPNIFPDCRGRHDQSRGFAPRAFAAVFLNDAPSFGRVLPQGGMGAPIPLAGGVHYTLTNSRALSVQGTRT
jgi:hypothetical protein